MSTVVVGYDGSEHARRALDRAATLAGPGDEVVVVVSVPVMIRAGRGPAPELSEEDIRFRKRALEDAHERLAGTGVRIRTVEGVGDPAEAIIAEARDTRASLIVVGTRGLSVAERILLGSVSTQVVHHAPCDVLVVR